ncbi:hypothetical protein D910_07676 [Dendroctonus ponderosae]|uniref:RNA-directed DNA polymerase n=2 Tax=Dendroctonus ponderosae TaxID=77166 RepID=U4UBB9_DENPD|nr:hypothetical protein D910_01710 [Dendroctonus ponderosae]ERL84302.1 hypothetical protein D910_01711 [Dendroctonus ponderosae]ERL90326.1 hypothetical protein D910_07675 [Dendroctonus ponderosae]ERL90327.1 hypothetical protein D910_07676 [Dendroctonus ponderosae]
MVSLTLRFYWPKMIHDIEQFVNSCEICQKNKYDSNPPIIKFKLTPTTSRPFEQIHAFEQLLENFCKLYKIELHYGTSKNSNSNSPVERFHSTLIEHYRCLKSKNIRYTPEQLIWSVEE